MVQTVDHDAVETNSNSTTSLPKSSNTSTIFTPRSVHSHTTMPTVTADSKKLENVSRKSNSPLSPPPVMKNSIFNYFIPTTE